MSGGDSSSTVSAARERILDSMHYLIVSGSETGRRAGPATARGLANRLDQRQGASGVGGIHQWRFLAPRDPDEVL